MIPPPPSPKPLHRAPRSPLKQSSMAATEYPSGIIDTRDIIHTTDDRDITPFRYHYLKDKHASCGGPGPRDHRDEAGDCSSDSETAVEEHAVAAALDLAKVEALEKEIATRKAEVGAAAAELHRALYADCDSRGSGAVC